MQNQMDEKIEHGMEPLLGGNKGPFGGRLVVNGAMEKHMEISR